MKKQIVLLLMYFMLLAGCAGTAGIQKNLNGYSYPLTYMHDTDPINEKGVVKIGLLKIEYNAEQFHDLVRVKRDKGIVIPLILFTTWNYGYTCTLGKKAVSEDIEQFIKESFLKESKRTGIYLVEENCMDCDYNVIVKINSFKTVGPYSKNGFYIITPFFWAYAFKQNAGPAQSEVSISAELIKDTAVVYGKSYTSNTTSRTLKEKYNKTGEMQKDYVNSMVESLSFSFKEGIENMVLAINEYLRNRESVD